MFQFDWPLFANIFVCVCVWLFICLFAVLRLCYTTLANTYKHTHTFTHLTDGRIVKNIPISMKNRLSIPRPAYFGFSFVEIQLSLFRWKWKIDNANQLVIYTYEKKGRALSQFKRWKETEMRPPLWSTLIDRWWIFFVFLIESFMTFGQIFRCELTNLRSSFSCLLSVVDCHLYPYRPLNLFIFFKFVYQIHVND